MARLRSLLLGAYPTVVFWLLLAQRALALDLSAVDEEGNPAPESLRESYQSLTVTIHAQVAATQASYRFHNRSDRALELECRIALSPREMVDGFSYYDGKQRIVGEVLERSTATAVYDQIAGVQRRDPGILEQEGDRFRFRVFPVAPGEDKPVEVATVTPLAMRDGYVEYVVPKENLPSADGTFALHALITDDLPIAEVEVVGFAGKVIRNSPRELIVAYEGKLPEPRQSLALRYRLASSGHGLRLVTHRSGDGDGSFMLVVSPDASASVEEVIGRDLVFVTDVSGSMGGEPLAQSKRGLLSILPKLSPEDRFEILSFDDESTPVFGKLVTADERHKKSAAQAIEALEVRGGTNIHGALLRALDLLSVESPGRPRAIVFLTDGQGDAPPALVLSDVQQRASSVRIYSFGMGEGVNRAFLERLAEQNRGTATFVHDEARIGEQMERLYARIAMPLMVDLELAFEGLAVSSVYPQRLPDLYRDGEVIVTGRYRPGRGRVVLRGRVRGGPTELALDLSLPEREPLHPQIEKLWASARVQHLLGSVELRGEEPELVQEVTRLGIVYDLVTPYTTFLAVPESVQTAEIKEQIKQGRLGYDKRLIDTLEGIELSQTAIPPGDPVLSVVAPADARSVTAYFPFGLEKELGYDARRGRWSVRFLVPRDVEDGRYTIVVRIEHREGRVEWKDIDYLIDAAAPELVIETDDEVFAGTLMQIRVDPLEPVREVYVALAGKRRARVELRLDLETGLYVGEIRVPESAAGGELELRVVAKDRARNRVEQRVKVRVLGEEDFGC